MRTRRMFGTTALAICALAFSWMISLTQASAQAVSSLPVAIYQGTCASDTISHVVDLEPIVPAASVTGASFAGSDQAIDVASSVTTLNISFADLMANAPLAIIVASGTGPDATELSCGVIGGFVSNNQIIFGIDDQHDSGISGIGSIADLGSTVSVTVILGEFPAGEVDVAPAEAAATSAACVEVAMVTSPHGPPVPGDADGDNITDTNEATVGTDPKNPDTDGDGLMDGLETDFLSSNPLDPNSPGTASVDPDADGLPTALETAIGTDPANADSDNDGIGDGWEFFLGNNPLDPEDPADAGTDTKADPDQDGLTTRSEMEMGTDPANPDTDFDGVSDGAEVMAGTNPLKTGC